MKKLFSIIGARPQFIKAATITRNARSYDFKHNMVNTGQHFSKNMSLDFIKELDIGKIDYNLNIGKKSSLHQISSIIKKLEVVFEKSNPDCVILYGDTNTTLAGAIAASKMKIKIAHIEAGLRSKNKTMPEEINRILTDHSSEFLFTPNKEATQNLIKENFDKKKIFQVGDVMFDSIKYYKSFLKKKRSDYIFMTLHRQENVDNKIKLELIVKNLIKLSDLYKIILPIHPRTKSRLIKSKLLSQLSKKITIINPQSYISTLELIYNSKIVMSDSGGIQKEAFFLNKRCLVLRNETEWNELIRIGANKLIPIESSKFCELIINEIKKKINFNDKELFGNGKSSHQILQILKKEL